MPEQTHWHTSAIEQRVAWMVAGCCLITILIASQRPQWFEFDLAKLFNAEQTTADNKQDIVLEQQPSKLIKEASKPFIPALIDAKKKPPLRSKPTAQKHDSSKITVHKTIPSKAHAARTKAGFYVQLGAFKAQSRAKGLADQISHLGWHAHIISRPPLYLVWSGPVENRKKAQQLQKSMAAKMHSNSIIKQQHKQ
ncbi:MAG: SPOR domain-containing protein [Mariprofundus sp.]|nr:SPOR domain-containing protein [Mariprofundus sp.]